MVPFGVLGVGAVCGLPALGGGQGEVGHLGAANFGDDGHGAHIAYKGCFVYHNSMC